MLLPNLKSASAEAKRNNQKTCSGARGRMRLDQKQVQESAKQSEAQKEGKPESKASRIVRNVVTVILVVGIIAFMVFLFISR